MHLGLSMTPQLRQEYRCAICDGVLIGSELGARSEAALHLLDGGTVEGWIEQGRCPASWCLGYARRPAPAVLERWLRRLARDASKAIRAPERRVDDDVLELLALAGRPGRDHNLAIRLLRAARGPRQTLAAAVWLCDGAAERDPMAAALRTERRSER